MTPLDHAAMMVDGVLIRYLVEAGFDSTYAAEKRQALARRVAIQAIFTYLHMASREVADQINVVNMS
jgi:hypothetical protein